MSKGATTHRLRLMALALDRRARLVLAFGARFLRWGRLPQMPIGLEQAPQDIRTADPSRALEIYAGRFVFAGKEVMCEGRSPFEVTPPSPEWERELLEFGWLRHLHAANTATAKANARAFIDDWIHMQGRGNPGAFRLPVLARRLISWLTHSPLIIIDADPELYRRFAKSLARQTRLLRCALLEQTSSSDRLLGLIALTYASLCLSGQQSLLKSASQRLASELDRQVLADGGHISRDPAMLVELLIDLLPLRQAYTGQQLTPPPQLQRAIDRMMPMLRFFRHGDGAFGLFNGMGATAPDLIATILAYDDARGRPVASATHAGYERLEAGVSVLLMETGRTPPLLASDRAHAGCLSFELSIERQRLVVNCGAPDLARADLARFTRATAAHSTAVLANRSSARQAAGWVEREFGAILVDGPQEVKVSRHQDDDGITVTAAHDGYLHTLGITHERQLHLAANGQRLVGIDRFAPMADHQESAPVDIRFHLHPSVKLSRQADGRGVLLIAGRETWAFHADEGEVHVEDSIYLGGAEGPRRTSQIVIHGKIGDHAQWHWAFTRLGSLERSFRATPAEEPELPF